MLLVVMGHVLLFSFYEELNRDGWQLFDIIAFFHMPLFFFITGMVMRYDNMTWNDIGQKLWSRFLRLMIPFGIFGLISVYVYGGHSVCDFLSADMKNGFWYLWVAMVFYVLTCLLIIFRKVWANKWGDLLFGIAITIGLQIGYNYSSSSTISWLSLYQIKTYFPYFFIASWLNHYGWIELICSNKYVQGLVLLLTPIGLFALVNGVPHIATIVRILCILDVILIMFMLDSKQNFVLSKLEEYGKNSLSIYCLHFFVILMFNLSFVGKWITLHYSMGLELLMAFVVSFVIIDIVSKIGHLLEKNSVLNRII